MNAAPTAAATACHHEASTRTANDPHPPGVTVSTGLSSTASRTRNPLRVRDAAMAGAA